MKSIAIGIIIGVALGGVLGYHSIYLRQQKQAQAIRKQISDVRAKQKAQQQAAESLEQLKKLRPQLPPEPEPSWLVQQATLLGRESGVELTAISPENPQAVQQFTRLGVNLQFDATYHQLGRFLDDIERAPYLIRVEHFAMGSPKDQSGRASVQLTLSALFLPTNPWETVEP